MKISMGKMLRVALFSLPLALPAFAQSAGGSAAGTPPSGSEAQPMGQQPSDTGQNPSDTERSGQGSMGDMNKDTNKGTSESTKSTTETTKTKKHRSSDTSGSQNY